MAIIDDSLPAAPALSSLLASIVDSSFDAIISKELNGTITSWNAAAEQLFGYTAEEAIGRSILMLIPTNRRNEETDIITRVGRGERVLTFETMRLRKDGRLIPVSLTVSPIRSVDGRIVGASKIARDISAIKENERRIRLLMREVNHRVKNQFSVILAIIRETNKRSRSPEEFEASVNDRIMALSRSQDLLVESDWAGTSLFQLIEDQLKPFGHEAQIVLDGPLLTLGANAVQHLGMAFHELGTNSAKYGALSAEVGRITVTWRLVGGAQSPQEISLAWEETSVPSATPDSGRKGFGTVVLQRVAPQSLNGTVTLDRRPGYLRWELVAPLSSVVQSDDHGGPES